MKTKKHILLLIILVILCLGTFAYFKNDALLSANSNQTSTTVSVKFVNSTISVGGAVTAQNQETLSFQTSGKLIYLPFKEGDSVLQGQVVARLDTAKLEATLRQAEQDFTAAKAASEKLYNDQGAKTDESFDEKVKRTAVDAAQNKAYDSVVKARQDITDATLVSSLDGIITHEGVTTTGVNITPATTLTVADPDTMVFRANVPLENIYYVSVGSDVTLAIDGIQQKLNGTVAKIYPSKVILPNGQAVYPVDIVSDSLQKYAKLDLTGTAIISTNSKNVALVPAWTVLSGKYIWVEDNGNPRLAEVVSGKIHGKEMEITKGLSLNDKIIINPKYIQSLKY